MKSYTSTWFQSFRASSGNSAHCIVPLLTELTHPKSVVDFGCGLGVWLAEFGRHGVEDVVGVDGSYVERDELLIDSSQFQAHDLSAPPRFHRRFDLCLCLEVAEHLPETSADQLVVSLTQAAPIIYFSAAIPTQGGTGHVNEQWPEYWADKFASRGFHAIDAIRRKVWSRDDVDFWYSQNSLIYASDEAVRGNSRLADELRRTEKNQLSLIHPKLFLRTSGRLRSTFDYRVRAVLKGVKGFGKRVRWRAA